MAKKKRHGVFLSDDIIKMLKERFPDLNTSQALARVTQEFNLYESKFAINLFGMHDEIKDIQKNINEITDILRNKEQKHK